ncbi:MAG: hypothetical protein JXR94_05940 [Candidatus Hydrogenedentes bacterium]|nr:hypothetical protein [Candidatus Hydrogenedentota bacterium]
MPSSISNSNDRLPAGPWLRILAAGLALAVAAVGAIELFWRVCGYTPSVVDDKALWCYQRDRVGHAGPGAVVLLGASRIQQAFVPDAFREVCPGHAYIQLAIGGWQPLAALRDIAENTEFAGLVVVSATAAGFLPETVEQQQHYVEYYHDEWGLDKKANCFIRTALQARLVLLYPSLSLQQAAPDLARGEWPLQWIWTRADRTQRVDYTRPDLDAFYASRLAVHRDNTERAATLDGYTAWPEGLEAVREWVARIQGRGGRVVLLRCPTGDGFWELDEEYFPRARFWDVLAEHTGAETIHFKDVPEMAGFQCAEGSHLFYEDAERFTRALGRELARRGLLGPESGNP